MNNIEIKSTKEFGPVVSSRTIASELGKEHTDVKNQISVNLQSENVQSEILYIESEYTNERNRVYKEYLLTEKGFTLYMFNIQGYNDFKIAYINEFERMKKQLNEHPKDSYMIDDPVERAKRWIEEAEERKALESKTQEQAEQLELNQPKVNFANALESSQTSILVGELSKLISQSGYKIGQNKLFKYMRENGYLCKNGERYNLPTQRSTDLGLMDIKKRVINNPDGSSHVTRTVKITGKGQSYFINKFINNVNP